MSNAKIHLYALNRIYSVKMNEFYNIKNTATSFMHSGKSPIFPVFSLCVSFTDHH